MTPEPTPIEAPPTAPRGWPVIVHPITGDRMVFLRTTRATQGRLLEVQFDLPPGAGGPPLHTHRRTHERFEVVSGSLEMRAGTQASWRTLQEGEALEVPPGTPHAFRNASDCWVTFVATVTPAGRAEAFFRAWYGLAQAGRVRPDGAPKGPLELALVLGWADFTFVGFPVVLQRPLFALLRGLAHLTGVARRLEALARDPAEAGR
jgi:quercetin dioxygenase-like cupin family protein